MLRVIGFVPSDASLGFGNRGGWQMQSPLCLWDAAGMGSALCWGPTENKGAFLAEKQNRHKEDRNSKVEDGT